MDLTKLSNRAAAEAGYRYVLLHPTTGEPLDDSDASAPAVFLRGAASRVAQDRLATLLRATKKKKEAPTTLEDVHKSLIENAKAFIIRFENVEIDGDPVGSDEKLFTRVLDLTFPEMAMEGRDNEGNPILELTNAPFAKQIIEAAADSGNFSTAE